MDSRTSGLDTEAINDHLRDMHFSPESRSKLAHYIANLASRRSAQIRNFKELYYLSQLPRDIEVALAEVRARRSRNGFLPSDTMLNRIVNAEFGDTASALEARANDLLAQGYSTKAVAEALGVTPRTVGRYKQAVKKRNIAANNMIQ